MAADLAKIRGVEPRPNHHVVVYWAMGGQSTIDLSDKIRLGGIYAAISDAAKFRAVRVGERKRTIEWPEPSDEDGHPIIEIDAEALRFMEQHQTIWARIKERFSASEGR
jgi:hypothetical protein